jgi:hypothetical protein
MVTIRNIKPNDGLADVHHVVTKDQCAVWRILRKTVDGPNDHIRTHPSARCVSLETIMLARQAVLSYLVGNEPVPQGHVCR